MIQRVLIPTSPHHYGTNAVWVNLKWVCPICKKKRGKVRQTYSYDGKEKLYCDCWTNPCRHIDKYDRIREEARTNGLNPEGIL